MIRIQYSFEKPEIAPILAHWSTLEWLCNDLAKINFKDRIKSYSERKSPNRLPITLVAFDCDLPIGMISLKEDDLPSRPDLAPWIASFYVVQEYRNKGIGTDLHSSLLKKAAELGFKSLYLNTYQAAIFYEKHNWNYECDATCCGGHKGAIYKINI